ncbi:tetratricopeptide repeat protein [Altererythrobacter sp.]|uniref:tetratricopeptide repeat protein n=1 Tax=Altererythrobacter sp. TaxID=1872480 RepID=UPI003CFBE684
MKKLARISTCALAVVALSGCQSFISKLGFGPRDDARLAQASGPVFGMEELEKGRMALKAGYPANAIQQFRLAATNEEVAPDAFNGLGVAYAKLGRADLAERYFKMALSLDGANPKFAANLERFYNSSLGNSARALAMRQKEAEAQLAAAEKAAEAQGLMQSAPRTQRMGAVTLETPAAQIVHTSKHEIHIATGSAHGSNSQGAMPSVASRNPDKKDNSQELLTDTPESTKEADVSSASQISFQGIAGSNESYPVRISLAKPGKAGSTRPRGSSYPLRIPLGAESATGE